MRRRSTELDTTAAQIQQRLADIPAAGALLELPLALDELAAAWEDHGIHFQRTLIGLLIDTITVHPATRRGPGQFDDSRLAWNLRC